MIVQSMPYPAAGGFSSDVSITLSDITHGAAVGVVAIQVWRGVDQVTPIDVATTTATGIDTGRANPPSITPSTSGAKVIGIGGGINGVGGSIFTSSDLSNFISRTRDNDSSTLAGIVGMGSIDWTSGAVNPAQFGGGSTGGGASWCAATVALRPASGETITYVGGTTADHNDEGSTWTASLTSLAGGLAAQASPGDFILVDYVVATSAGNIDLSVTGFTELCDLFSDDTGDTNFGVYWKIAA